MKSDIDPVDIAVISARMQSICKEMGETMLRTSRSPIFSEARDFTTAVFDHKPELLAQTIYIPDIAAATPFAAKAVAERFVGDVHEGDLFILNDPYRGNNHPPDLNVMKPVFWDKQLRYWLLSKGHHADMGGGGVVGYNPEAHDAWEDALRIPCLRLADRGVLREDVLDFILLNIRARDLVEGDIHCQIGAVNLGERRLLALLEHYGYADLSAATAEILDATERRVRADIAKIPDGEYSAERAIDHDGIEFDKSPVVRLCLKVQGDKVIFDYSDSDAQSIGYINSTLPNTSAMSQLALFSTHAISNDIQFNDGAVRPLEIIAPEGTIVNAREPAPTSCCTLCIGEAMIEAIWLALAQVIPEQVSAMWGRWCAPATMGMNPANDRFFADIHFMSKGGGGAVHGYDGWDHVGTPVTLGGLRAPDPELHELVTPYSLLEYEIETDTGGAGEWRGGMGVRYAFQVEADNVACANFGSGMRNFTAPEGIAGGEAAPAHRLNLEHADGSSEELDGNRMYTFNKGDRISIVSSGGGGYGDPKQRSPERVLRDVHDGLVSVEQARLSYAVVVTKDDSVSAYTIDEEKTRGLRSA
ncbi:MAG: hydantoinase B/oxoprolinase family protein [Gammaproteobacteria bacterium]|nr:hydantoinase B/oxoprolinase family protein [Gammaproteobacteria bacterium]